MEIRKNKKEVYRISHSAFRGVEYVDLRIYYENNFGEYLPTKRGVSIERTKVPKIIEGLLECVENIS